MSDSIFIVGMFVTDKETEYGTFQKISVDMQKFNEFAREHGQKSETNGKLYVNIDLMKSRDGNKSYMKLNTWKPKSKEEDKQLINSKDEAFEEDDIPF